MLLPTKKHRDKARFGSELYGTIYIYGNGSNNDLHKTLPFCFRRLNNVIKVRIICKICKFHKIELNSFNNTRAKFQVAVFQNKGNVCKVKTLYYSKELVDYNITRPFLFFRRLKREGSVLFRSKLAWYVTSYSLDSKQA